MTPNPLVNFEKVQLKHKDIIFSWLSQPHIQAFWDNSQAHKDDIIYFIEGRKVPSNYANGHYVYWIATIENHPYALIMTIKENQGENREPIKTTHISQTGATYSLDYMIGDPEYIGKGLGAPTLEQFLIFFQAEIDSNADTFFIDPDVTNPRAKHIYEKAGFQFMGDFILGGTGVFAGRKTHFMVKQLALKPTLIPATLADYPTIQNLARFYAYDMSRYCGFISHEWTFPSNGLYESHDFKKYFTDPVRKAFLVKIGPELAGFVLLYQSDRNIWNMGEFYIVAKFQGKGIARKIAQQTWQTHSGEWEVEVIPENTKALSFWRKVINEVTHGKYQKSIQNRGYDTSQPKRYVLHFYI